MAIMLLPVTDQYCIRRNFAALLIGAWMICAITLAHGTPNAAGGHDIHGLSQVKTIYVEPIGHGKVGDEFRERIIARLRKDGRFDVVQTSGKADAVMSGSAEVWVTGYVSNNPHAPATAKQAVYSGFLSARITSKGNEVLWSYLVTPRKFAWGGIVRDLADGLTAKLLEARSEKNDAVAAVPSTSTSTVTLRGAGATFPAPLYQKWFQTIEEGPSNEHISYEGVGSEEGIRLLAAGKIDFAASDIPVSDERMAQSGSKVRHFASVLGGVVPIYNLAGILRPLNFTPEVLAGIYLGKIKRWNDPQIRSVNRGANLPDSEIVVVHRSDGSGTTFVWSDFLSKVSPEWKSTVGRGSELKWPVGEGAERNEGVAIKVHETPNAIGYVEMVFALQHQLSYGAVRNAAGQFVRADLASVTAAANSAEAQATDFRVSITNASGAGAYPIASFTWLLLPERADGARRSALDEMLEWVLTSGQKECSELGYAPLPRDLANRELEALRAKE
jgi:phosphate ABC transporter phosphate-binding protein